MNGTTRACLSAVLVTLVAGPFAHRAGAAGPASRRPERIDVVHGRNALTRAIGRADPGDILRIHRGRYREVLEIPKPLTLKAVGPGRVTVDGECRAQSTINVISDGVTLNGLRVVGATEGFGSVPSEVTFAGVANGRARNMVFRDTCDAEYGINIFDTGSMVVSRSVARGFSDAGFYIGGITTGPVIATNNEGFSNNRGIIIEDSTPGTVTVSGNEVHDNAEAGLSPNPGGIDIIRTNGVSVAGNTVVNNLVYGIRADDQSTGNLIYDNAISGSGTTDAYDQTGANCWNGTTAATRQPDPLPTC